MEEAVVPISVEDYYRRYGPMVLRRCRSLLKDENEAMDAMQDTFVRIVRNQARLDDSSPASLLYRTATHVCLNRLRTLRRHPEHRDDELLDQIASFEETEEQSVGRSVLGRLFHKEPESTRTIAVLHLMDGLTLEETAREVGMSVSGVRKRLRGLQDHLSRLEGNTHVHA